VCSIPIPLPPPIAQKSTDSQRGRCQVKDAGVEVPGRLVAQLLGCAGADRTLRFCRQAQKAQSANQYQDEKNFVFHKKVLSQNYPRNFFLHRQKEKLMSRLYDFLRQERLMVSKPLAACHF
jgi:hypothetical protein